MLNKTLSKNKKMDRIANAFKKAKQQKGYAFVSYFMASDGGAPLSKKVISMLPKLNVDIIELGLCFSDPMAEGKAIQAASKRTLDSGYKINQAFEIADDFRKTNSTTPIILMGYYNPILAYGKNNFCQKASESGVDGVIIVDLPLEEEAEFLPYAQKHKLNFIKLITPTTSLKRAKEIVKTASGFVYYISVKGITGSKSPDVKQVEKKVNSIKKLTNLPVVVGFGIKQKQQIDEIKTFADGVVVGSSIVSLFEGEKSSNEVLKDIEGFLSSFN